MNNRLFLDVHAIQTLPPSNINRDDTGSPKTAQYGGVRRARVSSQSWKRAIRKYFYGNSQESNVGIRTLKIVEYVADKIREIDSSIGEEDALKMADKVLNDGNIKTKDYKAKALFFLGDTQAKELAKAAIDEVSDKKKIQEIVKSNPSIDIALFGRMLADDPYLNEDASCQVAHAISTHSVQTEFDYFTAVDDLASEDNAGAGMVGTMEFNSSTLYRYANVAVHELCDQIGDDEAVIKALALFVEAFAKSLPTGKINSFANQTLPQLLLVTLREDRPVNLVSAFENPVKSKEGFVDGSIERLFEEYTKVQKFVKDTRYCAFVTTQDNNYSEKQNEVESLDELVSKLSEELKIAIPEK